MAKLLGYENGRSFLRDVLASAVFSAAIFAVFAVMQTWGRTVPWYAAAVQWRTVAWAAAVGAAFGIELQVLFNLAARAGLRRPSLVKEVGGQPRADWKGIIVAYAWVIPVGALLVLHLCLAFGTSSKVPGGAVIYALLMPLIYHTGEVNEWHRKRRGELEQRRASLAADRERIIAEARRA